MSRIEYKNWAVTATGDVVGGSAVEVRVKSTGALADLYDADTAGLAISNPLTADADGSFSFFVAPGNYNVTVGSGASESTVPFYADRAENTFQTIAGMALSETPNDGDVVSVDGGRFEYLLGSSLTADGALVVDGIGGQWISTRTALESPSDLENDPRSGFAAGTGFKGGEFDYEVLPVGAATESIHITSAGGTLFKLLPTAAGHYNFAGMNPAMDGATDDYPKLEKLLGAVTTGSPWYVSGPSIFFPSGGDYFIGQTIELKKSVHLWGRASGLQSDSPAQLVFPPDTQGIVVNRYNTLDNNIESPPTTAADASVIDGLKLRGGGGSDQFAHGIWARARCVIRNCHITGFAGCGIAVWAASNGPGEHTPTSGDPQGNANLTHVSTTTVAANFQDGLRVDGFDANAGYFEAINAVSNGRYGIRDSSFLGNTYVGCHTATNGVAGTSGNATDSSSFVTFGGRRYSAHPDASEADLVATQPGTDETVWSDSGPGGVHPQIPLWETGKPEGTYFNGGAYLADNVNARNVFLGCYSESGSAGASFTGPSLVIGGAIGDIVKGSQITGKDGGNLTARSFSTSGAPVKVSLSANEVNQEVMAFSHEDDNAAWTWRLRRVGADWRIDNASSGARVAMQIHGENTAIVGGTSGTLPYIASFPILGVGTGANLRRQTTGTAAPASGAWGRGDIVWNVAALSAGNAGWICTTAGTAGTTAVFKTFGTIAA